MNWLELTNRLRQEAGAVGADFTSVANAGALTREGRRYRDWINAAWRQLQRMRTDWQWMRLPVQFTTVAQQGFYTPAQAGLASFRNWKVDSFRASTQGANFADEQILVFLEWTRYRNLYQYAQQRFNYMRPTVLTVDPEKRLGLGGVPDAAYVIVGEYWRGVTDFAADTDEPTGLPEDYHEIIVWLALVQYAGFESASEVYVRAKQNYGDMIAVLVADQGPPVMLGAPLA